MTNTRDTSETPECGPGDVVVIEDHDGGLPAWIVSVAGPNPEPDDCFRAATRNDAFTAQRILREAYSRGSVPLDVLHREEIECATAALTGPTGYALRYARKTLGMTREEFGQAVGRDAVAIEAWETGAEVIPVGVVNATIHELRREYASLAKDRG